MTIKSNKAIGKQSLIVFRKYQKNKVKSFGTAFKANKNYKIGFIALVLLVLGIVFLHK